MSRTENIHGQNAIVEFHLHKQKTRRHNYVHSWAVRPLTEEFVVPAIPLWMRSAWKPPTHYYGTPWCYFTIEQDGKIVYDSRSELPVADGFVEYQPRSRESAA